MASLSSLVYCLWVRQGAYPIVEHLKGSSIGYVPALQTDIGLGWKSLQWTNTLAYYKHLYITAVKSFFNIGPWLQCYKTFLSVIYVFSL